MNIQLPQLSVQFYCAALPILLLCASSMVVLLMGVSKKCSQPGSVKALNFFVLAVTLIAIGWQYSSTGAAGEVFLSGGFVAGRLGYVGQGMIVGIALIVSLLIGDSYLTNKFYRGEIISIFHMVLAGMLTMVATDDLVTLFVGLEMASIGVYALIGYVSPNKLSQEGAIKYFVLGSIAAAVLLFGFAFLYASTGSLRISEIGMAIGKVSAHPWIELGTIFTLVGIGFKMALVPFHMWTPDAYEGAPTGMTAFMATAMKTMIMFAAIRIFESGLSSVHGVWIPALGFMATASLLFANIMALAQQSMKRMLAYSSIAHSGYMALSFMAMNNSGGKFSSPAVVFYMISYVVVSLGAFGILMWMENERCENIIVDDMTGLAKQHPYAATAMAIFMLSLGGMPPTVGFISKLYIFNATLGSHLIGPIVIAAIGSTISLYYYMRIIVRMFMMDESPVLGALIKPTRSLVTMAVVAVSVLFVVLYGTVMPESLLRVSRAATTELTGG